MAFAAADAPAPAAIGHVLSQLDVACADAPEPIRRAVAACRHWLARDAARGSLAADTLRTVNDWQPWMVAAALAWDRGQPLAAMPAEWAAAAAEAIPTPAPPAARAPAAAGETVDVLVLPAGFDDEMTELFCAESQDLLQEVEQGVLALERNPADAASIDVVFRVFHTFKGNAGVLKLVVLQRLTHELESVLDAARRGRLAIDREAIDLILAGADVLRRYVTEALAQLSGHERGRSIPLPVPDLIARVQKLLGDRPPTPPAAQAPAAPSAARADAPQVSPPVVVTPAPVAASIPAPAVPAPTAATTIPSAPAAGASEPGPPRNRPSRRIGVSRPRTSTTSPRP